MTKTRDLIRSLRAQGAVLRPTSGGHVKVYRGGVFVTSLSPTKTGDEPGKNVLGIRARLRRAGFKV